MGTLNIFKLLPEKYQLFQQSLSSYQHYTISRKLHRKDYNLDLFLNNRTQLTEDVRWRWLLNEFKISTISIPKQPWAILIIHTDKNIFALSFGNAFYWVDKYSDRNFPLILGRKFNYNKIKTTTQSNPNSNKNKSIFSYLNNKYFEYDSGESFIKIKGNINLPTNFKLFKSNVEIGTSFKIITDEDNLNNCILIIKYIEGKLLDKDVTKIPIFNKIKDTSLISLLNYRLEEAILRSDYSINFSDFDIIGTSEVFYSENTEYELRYGRKRKKVATITQQEIELFCIQKNIEKSKILDIEIKAIDPYGYSKYYTIKELIDYTDEEYKSILMKGDWYVYNDDYLDTLAESLSDLQIIYDPTFNWDNKKYELLIESKYNKSDYPNIPKGKALEKLKEKYYKERAYNIIMSLDFGYELIDRSFERLDINGKIEIADLYKDNTIFAVKIGNTSSKLCYGIDQLSTSAKLIKKKLIKFDKQISKVALWIVLERAEKLPIKSGRVDINKLNLLVFKNKLDTWQKDMRQLSYEPILIIAYKH